MSSSNDGNIFVISSPDKEKAFEEVVHLLSYRIKGQRNILIKPNIVSMEGYPTTTDPFLLKKLVGFLVKRKKSFCIVDGPSPDDFFPSDKKLSGDTREEMARKFIRDFREDKDGLYTYGFPPDIKFDIIRYTKRMLGDHALQKAVSPFNIEIKDIHDFSFNDIKLNLKKNEYRINCKMMNCETFDSIINLPVLKLHTTCGITAASKNLYGFLDPFDKMDFHRKKIVPEVVNLLPGLFKVPIITILDAFIVPDAQEHRWSELKRQWRINKLIFGSQPLKVDKMALKILKEENLDGGACP